MGVMVMVPKRMMKAINMMETAVEEVVMVTTVMVKAMVRRMAMAMVTAKVMVLRVMMKAISTKETAVEEMAMVTAAMVRSKGMGAMVVMQAVMVLAILKFIF